MKLRQKATNQIASANGFGTRKACGKLDDGALQGTGKGRMTADRL